MYILAHYIVFVIGVKWQTRRKILTPTFHFNILNQFVDILIKEGDCMTKSLMDVGGTVIKDLLPFISEHTLNAICGKAFVKFLLYVMCKNFILNDHFFKVRR